ncbi:hypothetical protein SFC02_10005 [Terribacillus goriensis]|uniref:hypothetical protein n=1 Tax=Terribacillus saccharophilus TaxID=361277 RepID=UPI0039834AEA
MERISISKKIKILLVIICLVAITGISVYIFLPFLSVHHDKTLEKNLNYKLKEEGTNSLDLGDYIEYDWKKAYIFTPYTTEVDMKKILGLTFHDPVNMSIRDDIELLVVIKEDDTFEYMSVDLRYGYLQQNGEYITPKNDVIEITRP